MVNVHKERVEPILNDSEEILVVIYRREIEDHTTGISRRRKSAGLDKIWRDLMLEIDIAVTSAPVLNDSDENLATNAGENRRRSELIGNFTPKRRF